MARGSVTKTKAQPVAVWLPDALKDQLDRAVQMTDTDRSKLIRAALREKLAALKLSGLAA
jgi:metal-responsive CopG/Arc/MetJ family transcriptional regulator